MNENTKNKSFSLKAIFDSRIFLAVISVLIAFFLWYNSYNSYGIKDERTISDIPIHIDVTGIYESYGLEIIEIVSPDELKDRSVDLKIVSPTPILRKLTADDFIVTVDTSAITQAGTYRLNVGYSCLSSGANVEISQSNPKYITVRFDRVKSKVFEIDDVRVSGNLTVKEGYIMETPDCNVKEITLTGPESIINKIQFVAVEADVNGVKSATEVFNGRFVYYDDDGNEINDSYLTNNYTSSIKVTLPIKQTKTLKLKVDFTNVPEGYKDNVSYSINPSEVTIKGDSDIIGENFVDDEYSIGKIDFKNITSSNDSFEFDINFGSGIETTTETLTKATVKLNLETLKSKTFILSSDTTKFKVINNMTLKAVKIVTNRISSVVVYGPASQINSLSESDITVCANLSGKQSLSGNCLVPATFEFNEFNKCWVASSHEIEVKINE